MSAPLLGDADGGELQQADDTPMQDATPQPAEIESPSDSGSSGSEDEDDEEEEQVEWLVTSRQKRATAGNRLNALLQQEEEEDEEDELALLFQEDEAEEDKGFEEADADSDVQMDSSSDEEDTAAAGGDDDLEGERALQRQEKAERAAKKRKLNDGIPKMFKKKVKIDPTAISGTQPSPAAAAARLKKKSERQSWIPSMEDLPTRASARGTTRQSKEQLHAQMVDRELKRLKQLRNMEKAAAAKEAKKKPALTQADRLAEAARVEKANAKSLSRWEESEMQREAEQVAKLAALKNRTLEGPVITWWSGFSEWVGGKLRLVGKNLVIEEPREKPAKKRKASEMEGEEVGKDVELNKDVDAEKVGEAGKDADPGKDANTGKDEHSGKGEHSGKDANSEKGVEAGKEAESAKDVDHEEKVESGKEDKSGETAPASEPADKEHTPEAPPSKDASSEVPKEDAEAPSKPSPTPEKSPTPPPAKPPTPEPPNIPIQPVIPLPPRSSVLAPPPGLPIHAPHPPPGSGYPPYKLVPPALDGSAPLPGFGYHYQQPRPNPLQHHQAQGTSIPAPTTAPAAPPAPPQPQLPPPPPEPPAIEHATRNYLILQNFEETAIKDKNVQTEIIFGRKFLKIPTTKHKTELCTITHYPAKYRDPHTGLAYCNSFAYKEIQRLKKGDYKWSKLVGAYVGQANFAARGVPPRFLNPKYVPPAAPPVPSGPSVATGSGTGSGSPVVVKTGE